MQSWQLLLHWESGGGEWSVFCFKLSLWALKDDLWVCGEQELLEWDVRSTWQQCMPIFPVTCCRAAGSLSDGNPGGKGGSSRCSASCGGDRRCCSF